MSKGVLVLVLVIELVLLSSVLANLVLPLVCIPPSSCTLSRLFHTYLECTYNSKYEMLRDIK